MDEICKQVRLLIESEGGRMRLRDVPTKFNIKYKQSLQLRKYSVKLNNLPNHPNLVDNLASDGSFVWIKDGVAPASQLSMLSPPTILSPAPRRELRLSQPQKMEIKTTVREENPTMSDLSKERSQVVDKISFDEFSSIFFTRKIAGKESCERKLNANNLFINGTARLHNTATGLGLLGCRIDAIDGVMGEDVEEEDAIYVNTSLPFCAVCIGVQGAGKSHTMNVLLENCLIPCSLPEGRPLVVLPQAMCGLVMHFDQSESNMCEAVGLRESASAFRDIPGALAVQDLVILVSPSYYQQRKKFYGDNPNCRVYPLLFDWASITATQLRKLMRLSDKDAQLYVSVMLNMLRDYQREQMIPDFESFLNQVKSLCTVTGQAGPLEQVRKYTDLLSGNCSNQLK